MLYGQLMVPFCALWFIGKCLMTYPCDIVTEVLMPTTEPNQTIEILKMIIPGLIGAGSALLGQVIANYYAERRYHKELQHKKEQSKLQFVAPIANRRIEAFEGIFSLVQKALDQKKLDLADYDARRPLFLYVDPLLRQKLIKALVQYIEEDASEYASGALKSAQAELENESGNSVVSAAVKEIIKTD